MRMSSEFICICSCKDARRNDEDLLNQLSRLVVQKGSVEQLLEAAHSEAACSLPRAPKGRGKGIPAEDREALVS